MFFIEIETSQNSYVSKAQQKRFFAESAHFFKCMLSAIKLNQELFKTVKFPVTFFQSQCPMPSKKSFVIIPLIF